MLGFEEEEFEDVLGSWASRLHPEDKDHVFAALQTPLMMRHQLPQEESD